MELKSGKDILVTGVLILSALTSGLLRAQTANFPLTASDPEPQRLVLDASLVQPAPPAQASQPELPNAPSSMLASSGPSSSLEDLGFAPQQTQAHEQLQAMLENPPAAWADYRDSNGRVADHRAHGFVEGEERADLYGADVGKPGFSCGAGRNNYGALLHDGLLCGLCAQGARDQQTWRCSHA